MTVRGGVDPGRGAGDDRDQNVAWCVLDRPLDLDVLLDPVASPHGDEVEPVGMDGRPVPGDAFQVHAPGPEAEAPASHGLPVRLPAAAGDRILDVQVIAELIPVNAEAGDGQRLLVWHAADQESSPGAAEGRPEVAGDF